MKKTILLTSLIAVASMAATTGHVEFSTGTELLKINETKLNTEVKVKDTGFSFGGELKLENPNTFIAKPSLNGVLEKSNVWAKYELPKIKDVNSSIKAKVEKDKVNLEADVNTMVSGVKVGINSNTSFPFASNKDYGSTVESTHKIYAEAKNVYVLDEVKGNLSVSNTYNKIEKNAKAKDTLAKAVKNVKGEVEVKYNKIKDLKLEGKAGFVVNVADEKLEYKNDGEKLFPEFYARYMHDYSLKAIYTGVKDTEIEVNPFLAHIGLGQNKISRMDYVAYGVNGKVTYKGIKNLTLTGKTQLAGMTVAAKYDKEDLNSITYGHFVFGANAKYDYKVSDKFTVSPELDAVTKFFAQAHEGVDELTFDVTPKVSAEYKPAESLTLKGGVELPIKFGGLDKDKFYKSTNVKTNLNIKYVW